MNLKKETVYINPTEYYKYCDEVYKKVNHVNLSDEEIDYDCIVAIKRSGFMLGVYLSNKGNCPMFTSSEINSIPENFTNVLIVDDKTDKGKTFKKVIHKLINHNNKIKVTTASLFRQGLYKSDIYIKDVRSNYIKLFYQRYK